MALHGIAGKAAIRPLLPESADIRRLTPVCRPRWLQDRPIAVREPIFEHVGDSRQDRRPLILHCKLGIVSRRHNETIPAAAMSAMSLRNQASPFAARPDTMEI